MRSTFNGTWCVEQKFEFIWIRSQKEWIRAFKKDKEQDIGSERRRPIFCQFAKSMASNPFCDSGQFLLAHPSAHCTLCSLTVPFHLWPNAHRALCAVNYLSNSVPPASLSSVTSYLVSATAERKNSFVISKSFAGGVEIHVGCSVFFLFIVVLFVSSSAPSFSTHI